MLISTGSDQLAAVHDVVESMLSPLDRKLAVAPLDNEPLSPEEAAAIEAGIVSLEQDGGVPMDQVRAEFGLTADQLEKE